MIEVKCSRNRPGTHWPVRPLDVLEDGHYHGQFIDDASRMEYFMPMRWLDHVPIERAVNEVGLFGNQNTVCRPRGGEVAQHSREAQDGVSEGTKPIAGCEAEILTLTHRLVPYRHDNEGGEEWASSCVEALKNPMSDGTTSTS